MDKGKHAQHRLHDILDRIRGNPTEQTDGYVSPGEDAEKGEDDRTLTSLRSMVEGNRNLDIHSMIRDVRSMHEVSDEDAADPTVQEAPAVKESPVATPVELGPEEAETAPGPAPAEEIRPAPESRVPAIDLDDIDALQGMIDSIFGDEGATTPAAPRLDEVDPEDIAGLTDTPAAPLATATPKKTRWSGGAVPEAGEDEESAIAGITNAEDIGALSELILPKAATFDVEELALDQAARDAPLGMGSLPPEIDTLWKEAFPTITEEARSVVIGKDQEKKAGFLGKINLFTKLVRKVEEYDPRRHGPLVDLAFTPAPGIEEVELYPVNEPYAYIRIIYDNASHEYTYEVLEPVLSDAEKELLGEIKSRLFEQLDVNTKDISRDGARKVLRDLSDEIISDYGISLTPVAREKLFYHIERDFLGDGLIDAIMHDKFIEDISCDGLDNPIFVFHGGYESIKTNMMYTNAVELDSFVTKLAQRSGKYISIAEPMLDATMVDGSRIQMTLGKEVTAHGSTFTIRKFKDEPITPTDLIEWGTFSPLSVAFLWLAVEAGNSAIFAGGTASGKTTALNAISLFIPPLAKIVSLEDTRELKLPHPNWIPSVTRDSFDTGGKGAIDMYELLRAALRQRPEYICVGEVRGKEAQTLFQAMSTGHVTYATMHADSVASVVHRLENPPLDVPRNMLTSLNLVCIQVQARVGGQRIRRNKQIIEILDIDPRTNELITNEVFSWHQATDEIRYSGKSYVLESIMETRGWSEARMREELKRRQEILEWMRRQKIRHFRDVSKMLISYFRDPDAVMDVVRHDLYGEGASQ
ncbi:MAG: ATPase, T2SS/T4P/T4SS family [Methanofollis sp.]|uniref:type II/IV secretion system ATPase subunit n=1 Tax=Methanofollis sp. TaxID=2052835 RepID=UPI002635A57D|nr:ATPase, T2SS/T4P/T4SS family [Methanofollis sp.]MDD4254964.1 ATPase, T2SS/T4P/T4SS family [Methanofollis sp.]